MKHYLAVEVYISAAHGRVICARSEQIKKMPSWSFRDTFSTPEQMRMVVNRALHDAREQLPVQEETWYDIKLILHELCCNALEHGQHPVEVFSTLCEDDNMLHILVADSGGGFVPEKNTQPQDVNAERGRGLAIVNYLAEDMVFNTTANKVLVRMQI